MLYFVYVTYVQDVAGSQRWSSCIQCRTIFTLQSTSHGEIKELTHPFGVIVVSCSAYFPALRELALKLVTQGNCVVLIIQQCDSNLNVSIEIIVSIGHKSMI